MSLSDISGNIPWFFMQQRERTFSDLFLMNIENLLCLWHTERGHLRTGDRQICLPRCWSKKFEEEGMPITHIVLLKTLDTEPQATVPVWCAPDWYLLPFNIFQPMRAFPALESTGYLQPLTAGVFSHYLYLLLNTPSASKWCDGDDGPAQFSLGRW